MNDFAEENGFSDAQIKWLAACQYLILLVELLVFGWLIYNILSILVRQGRYKSLPLLTFYMLATVLLVVRIFSEIMWWKQ